MDLLEDDPIPPNKNFGNTARHGYASNQHAYASPMNSNIATGNNVSRAPRGVLDPYSTTKKVNSLIYGVYNLITKQYPAKVNSFVSILRSLQSDLSSDAIFPRLFEELKKVFPNEAITKMTDHVKKERLQWTKCIQFLQSKLKTQMYGKLVRELQQYRMFGDRVKCIKQYLSTYDQKLAQEFEKLLNPSPVMLLLHQVKKKLNAQQFQWVTEAAQRERSKGPDAIAGAVVNEVARFDKMLAKQAAEFYRRATGKAAPLNKPPQQQPRQTITNIQAPSRGQQNRQPQTQNRATTGRPVVQNGRTPMAKANPVQQRAKSQPAKQTITKIGNPQAMAQRKTIAKVSTTPKANNQNPQRYRMNNNAASSSFVTSTHLKRSASTAGLKVEIDESDRAITNYLNLAVESLLKSTMKDLVTMAKHRAIGKKRRQFQTERRNDSLLPQLDHLQRLHVKRRKIHDAEEDLRILREAQETKNGKSRKTMLKTDKSLNRKRTQLLKREKESPGSTQKQAQEEVRHVISQYDMEEARAERLWLQHPIRKPQTKIEILVDDKDVQSLFTTPISKTKNIWCAALRGKEQLMVQGSQ